MDCRQRFALRAHPAGALAVPQRFPTAARYASRLRNGTRNWFGSPPGLFLRYCRVRGQPGAAVQQPLPAIPKQNPSWSAGYRPPPCRGETPRHANLAPPAESPALSLCRGHLIQKLRNILDPCDAVLQPMYHSCSFILSASEDRLLMLSSGPLRCQNFAIFKARFVAGSDAGRVADALNQVAPRGREHYGG